MDKRTFAVLGAGSGGHSIAGYLAMQGHAVRIQDVDQRIITGLQNAGKIRLTGKIEGEGALELVTDDPVHAISGAHIIMVVTPTNFHIEVARRIAPFIQENQLIVLNPGQTGGALEFRNILKAHGCSNTPIIAETQDLLFSCRMVAPGVVRIGGIKKMMNIASLPATAVNTVLEVLSPVFPQLRAVPNVLYTSLDNMGAMCHPAPTLLNTARIELQHDFDFYGTGITPGVAQVLEKLDAERLAVGAALGIELTSMKDWQQISYGIEGESLFEVLQNNGSYQGMKAPLKLDTRFLSEDVPCGLVPIAYLGRWLNVDTPVTNSLIELSNITLNRNYWVEGRTLNRLGLEGKSIEEALQWIS